MTSSGDRVDVGIVGYDLAEQVRIITGTPVAVLARIAAESATS